MLCSASKFKSVIYVNSCIVGRYRTCTHACTPSSQAFTISSAFEHGQCHAAGTTRLAQRALRWCTLLAQPCRRVSAQPPPGTGRHGAACAGRAGDPHTPGSCRSLLRTWPAGYGLGFNGLTRSANSLKTRLQAVQSRLSAPLLPPPTRRGSSQR